MFSASSYACFELFKRGELLHENWLEVSVAFVAAMLTGFAVVKWLLGYIKNHSLRHSLTTESHWVWSY